MKDRLYLVEGDDWPTGGGDDDEDDGDTTALVRSRRILVLSLQGDILQVVTHPTEPIASFESICSFGRKLLASYTCYTRTEERHYEWDHGMLALQAK